MLHLGVELSPKSRRRANRQHAAPCLTVHRAFALTKLVQRNQVLWPGSGMHLHRAWCYGRPYSEYEDVVVQRSGIPSALELGPLCLCE